MCRLPVTPIARTELWAFDGQELLACAARLLKFNTGRAITQSKSDEAICMRCRIPKSYCPVCYCALA